MLGRRSLLMAKSGSTFTLLTHAIMTSSISFHSPPGAAEIPPGEPPTVFLPGWGFDGRVLGLARPPFPWLAPAGPLDPERLVADLLAYLDRERIDRIRLVGWSMGGMLALDFAMAHADRVAALVLIGVREHWPGEEIETIRREFRADRKKQLTDFYRKCFLGHKEIYRRFAATLQPDYPRELDPVVLERGLSYLAARHLGGGAAPAGIPVHSIHGRRDVLFPVDEMAIIRSATREIVENGGHAVFLAPACSLGQELRKERLRQRFSRAATTYDRYGRVQKQVADLLGNRLAEGVEGQRVADILEIGCGTGTFTGLLSGLFPGARIEALDFAAAMLEEARRKLGETGRVTFICREGEKFLEETARGGQRYDLIASNGALQWFSDLDLTLGHMKELLRPGGQLALALFGPRTMEELGDGLSAVLGYKGHLPARDFISLEALGDLLRRHFPMVRVEEKILVREYPSLLHLLRHIRNTGTSGWPEAASPLLTRARLARLEEWFRKQHNGCRITYQILMARAGCGEGW